jgi:hypothetical protein
MLASDYIHRGKRVGNDDTSIIDRCSSEPIDTVSGETLGSGGASVSHLRLFDLSSCVGCGHPAEACLADVIVLL